MKKKNEFIIEDFNNGLSEEEILEKYKIKKSTLQTYLSQARKRGMEVKTREKAKPKYIPVAEDWNNGLPEEEILEKYNIVKKILQAYLSQARKRGIEVKTREKAKPKYVQIVEDWNNGLPEDEILVKYNMVKQNLQNYLNRARKRGIEVKAREKAKPKYIPVAEDWNNGLPEEEILEKYNIVKKILQAYLSQARKRGIEVKTREKAKPKYVQIVEDWNNGLPEDEILVKYNMVKQNLQNYLNRARKRGIEVKAREKAKSKDLKIVEDWNNGLSEEEILKKYNIKKITLQTYLSQARKRGIEVKAREKAKPKYMQVAEDWNNGLSEEEILVKYNIVKEKLHKYLNRARRKGLEVKVKLKYIQVAKDLDKGLTKEEIMEKYQITPLAFSSLVRKAKKHGVLVVEKTKPKYMQVAEDWNNGLSEEEILKKYNIIKSTLQTYLSRAKKERIEVKARKKVKPKYMEVTEDWNNGLSEEKIIFQKDQKRSREKIKESLKLYLPRQVAKRLKISTKTVFDVMDSLNSEERKEVNKAFIRNRPYVFSRVKKLKKDGKSVLEALKSIESNIPLHLLSQLQEVYYNLRLYSYIEKSINKRIYLDETISGKEYLKGLKETMHLEVISVQIRKKQKEALKNEKSISYDRLCKDFNVRTNFLVDLLGREEKDY